MKPLSKGFQKPFTKAFPKLFRQTFTQFFKKNFVFQILKTGVSFYSKRNHHHEGKKSFGKLGRT